MGGLDRMIQNAEREGTATGDRDADALLREDGNALLMGILLDQQIRAEVAFSGPHKLKQRLGHLDVKRIAQMDADAFRSVFSEKPAVHRFANMMADRVQALAKAIAEQYDGDASHIWKDGADLPTVEQRARKLPGFGPGKVRMMAHALPLFEHRTFGS